MREKDKIYIFTAIMGVLAGSIGGYLGTLLDNAGLMTIGVAFLIFYLTARSIPTIFQPEERKNLSSRMKSGFFGFLIGWLFGIGFFYSLLSPPDPDKYLNQSKSLLSFLIGFL